MKRIIAVLCLGSLCAIGHAQQGNPSSADTSIVSKSEQATPEDVQALIEVTHGRRNAQAGMDMMREQMKRGSRDAFLKKYPDASPEVLKKLDGVLDGAMKVVTVDELIPAMVPVYQKYLSHNDAISIISFYSSPAGQKYLDRMPAMLKEVGDVSGAMVRSHLDEIQSSTEKGMKEFEKYIADHPDQVGAKAGAKDSESN